MKELISVIVPVYNVEKYLEKCLNSIMYQTYSNLEILLIDDGSTDQSGRICNKYAKKDKRIKVIHKANTGLADSRNVGLKMATGQLVGFVDSDDYIEFNMFEMLYHILQKYNADIAVCGVEAVDENGKSLQHSKSKGSICVLDSKEAVISLLEGSISTIFCNKLCKKELFDEIKFPSGKIMEDLATFYRVLDKADKIVISQEVKYYYVQRKGSLIHTNNSKLLTHWLEITNERYDKLSEQYPDLKEPLIVDKLYCIANLFKLFYGSNIKDEKLEKALQTEYIFYQKYYKMYRSKSKITKNARRAKLELQLLNFSPKIFCVYSRFIGFLKRRTNHD